MDVQNDDGRKNTVRMISMYICPESNRFNFDTVLFFVAKTATNDGISMAEKSKTGKMLSKVL